MKKSKQITVCAVAFSLLIMVMPISIVGTAIAINPVSVPKSTLTVEERIITLEQRVYTLEQQVTTFGTQGAELKSLMKEFLARGMELKNVQTTTTHDNLRYRSRQRIRDVQDDLDQIQRWNYWR